MDEHLRTKTQELIDSGLGDTGRLEHIMDYIVRERQLFKSDLKYLENMHRFLLEKIANLEKENTNLKPNAFTLSEPRPNSKLQPLLADEDIDRILDEQEKRKQKQASPRNEYAYGINQNIKTGMLKKLFKGKKS